MGSDEKKRFTRRTFLSRSLRTGAGVAAASVLGNSIISSSMHRKNSLNIAQADDHIGTGTHDPNKPYNILFIMVDQERYFKKMPKGLMLPAHERMKRTGVSFDNHYICSSVCTPSRSNILTGQHIVHTGMFDNTNFPWQQDMSRDIPTLGHMLQKAGYYTTYKGKWHLSQEFEQPWGSDMKLLTDKMAAYGFSDYFSVGDVIGHELGGHRNDHLIAGMSINWLRREGVELRKKGQPWFMVSSFVNPHDIMYFNTDLPSENVQDNGKLLMHIERAPDHAHYDKTYDEPLPDNAFQPLKERGRPTAHYEGALINDMFLGAIPQKKDNLKRYQDYYYNCIAEMDLQVMRLLIELDKQDLTKDTIIVFTADHGEMAGAHGLRQKGGNAYEEDCHVPFIIVHPKFRGGQRCRALSEHVDIATTVLGLSGIKHTKRENLTKGLPGKDLSKLLENPGRAGATDARIGTLYAQNMFTSQDPGFYVELGKYIASGKDMAKFNESGIIMDMSRRNAIRSVFDGRYKYTRYFAPLQHNQPETLAQILKYNDIELFDLEEDPKEMRNLADDTDRNKKLILAMNEKLNTLIDEEIGDDVGQMLPATPGVDWAVRRFDP